MKYASPSSFRQAVDARLTKQAREVNLDRSRLQRRLAYERFLARVFRPGGDRWVLKGGYALELRLGGRARATKDLDLNAPPGSGQDLLEELQNAADLDLGDFLTYAVSWPKEMALAGPPEGGYRFRVEARLGEKHTYSVFVVDVGQGDTLLGPVEWLPARVDLEFAGLETPAFPSYPLPEHFAEKLHAYTRPRGDRTRVKDLVDLVLIVEDLGLEPGPEVAEVVRSVFERYGSHPIPTPATIQSPPTAWEEPYRRLAEELALAETSTPKAHQRLVAFLAQLGANTSWPS